MEWETELTFTADGRQDLYPKFEYVTPEEEKVKIRALYRDGYLFVVGPDGNNTTLNREFPNPEKLVGRMSSQYDIAVSLLIKTIPIGLKTVFLTYVQKSTDGREPQQRDDEPESAYRLRRANGEAWNELIDKVISQGNEVSTWCEIGWN